MKSIVLFALLVSGACATPAVPLFKDFAKGRITNGQNALVDQFPYQVSIRWVASGTWEHWCGGSIISPLYVLTAGHCVTGLPSFGGIQVNAGVLNVNENGVLKKVESSVVHPLYQGGIGPYDIAVLRLESPFTFSESIQPIALPAAGSEPQGQAVFSGWGDISTTINPSYPDILQYVNIPILSYSECAAALTGLFGSPEPLDASVNTCSGPLYEGISPCTRDSGGPLAQTGANDITVVVGIASWGITPCGYPGAPSIYTKVSSFIDFIKENVPDLP